MIEDPFHNGPRVRLKGMFEHFLDYLFEIYTYPDSWSVFMAWICLINLSRSMLLFMLRVSFIVGLHYIDDLILLLYL